MSDEHLDALGLPRREFLKRAAIGAGVFAAPMIVSFGLGGTAEAASNCFANQTVANQWAGSMSNYAVDLFRREWLNESIDPKLASKLRQKMLDSEAKLLDLDLKGSCRLLDEIIHELQRQSGRRVDPSVATQFINAMQNQSAAIGCDSC